ncbi:MAG: hypothetical protein J1E04_01340 [Alistipes sp.]|nr:hypothetical protein [Alistipes sp.]
MKRLGPLALALIFTLNAAVLQVCAQTAETETEAAEAEQTQSETALARLEKWQQIMDKLPHLSGFIQFFYAWEDTRPATSQFRVRRARITLAGDIYKNYADYNFMAEFAGDVKLIDAYLRFTPWKQFNLQAGSFRPAFTLENTFYGATTTEFIEYPQIVSRMTTIGDIAGFSNGSAGRDIGIQAFGGFFNQRGFSTLQYYAGVFNGHGLSFKGINSHKDIAAMLRVNPTKNLAIAASIYWGKWACAGAGTYADRNRWSAGFIYDDSKWFARGEYIGGETGALNPANLLVAPAPGKNLNSDGAYLLAGVWFCNRKIAPLFRADFYSQNTRARKETTDISYTVGVDCRPWKYLRCQLNYSLQTHTFRQPNGNQIAVMVTGMF